MYRVRGPFTCILGGNSQPLEKLSYCCQNMGHKFTIIFNHYFYYFGGGWVGGVFFYFLFLVTEFHSCMSSFLGKRCVTTYPQDVSLVSMWLTHDTLVIPQTCPLWPRPSPPLQQIIQYVTCKIWCKRSGRSLDLGWWRITLQSTCVGKGGRYYKRHCKEKFLWNW